MGRPFVKRFREERELAAVLAVDVSASSAFGMRGTVKVRPSGVIACVRTGFGPRAYSIMPGQPSWSSSSVGLPVKGIASSAAGLPVRVVLPRQFWGRLWSGLVRGAIRTRLALPSAAAGHGKASS
jgi:hypothetical protein